MPCVEVVPALAIDEDPRVLPAPQRVEPTVAVARREQHLHELVRELLPERLVDLAVQHDDAAVRRGRVGCQCALVRLADRRADGDTAWVGVLDDHARRKRELACKKSRSGKIVQVVEGQRLAVQLLDAGQ